MDPVMDVLDLTPIQHDNQNSLRNYSQKFNTTVIKMMGYDGALKSVKNVTNAIMRLPKYFQQKFYRDFRFKTAEGGRGASIWPPLWFFEKYIF